MSSSYNTNYQTKNTNQKLAYQQPQPTNNQQQQPLPSQYSQQSYQQSSQNLNRYPSQQQSQPPYQHTNQQPQHQPQYQQSQYQQQNQHNQQLQSYNQQNTQRIESPQQITPQKQSLQPLYDQQFSQKNYNPSQQQLQYQTPQQQQPSPFQPNNNYDNIPVFIESKSPFVKLMSSEGLSLHFVSRNIAKLTTSNYRLLCYAGTDKYGKLYNVYYNSILDAENFLFKQAILMSIGKQ
jgi:hypothetical protein